MTNTASAGMAGMGTANTANTMSTSDTSADRASSNQWQNDDRGAVETLAESGNVSLKGTISSIDKEDKELTLRDSKGNTIDVHSTAALDNLREGDKVSVRGEVRDEMAGMGKEIVNARVMEIRQ